MNGLNYLLQTNLYLMLFMGFYILVLRNETFFRQNRIYLNASVLLSFAIPFIYSPWFRDLFITQKVREVFVPSQTIYETIVVGVNEEASRWTIGDVIFWVYISGTAILLARFLIRLILLRSNLKPEKGSAFSFLNQLVVDRELPNAETIIDHEKVHMRQWHSADIILIELAAIINWFNPIVYLYKKEIRHIHEFTADEEAASLLQCKSDYALLLFSNTLGIDPHQLTNSFFNQSLLKRRIIMLNKNKSGRTGLWKYGLSAPLFAAMLILSAATVTKEQPNLMEEAEKLISPIKNNSDSTLKRVKLSEVVIMAESKDISTSNTKSVPNSPATDIKNQENNHASLMKHMQKNLKYPPSAGQNKITGYVLINFRVQDQKITSAEITKSLQKDIDDEVLRSFNLFKDPIQVENNTYSMAILFQLTGVESKVESLPGQSNFVGQIAVTGYGASGSSLNTGNTKTNNDQDVKDFASVEVLPEFDGSMAK